MTYVLPVEPLTAPPPPPVQRLDPRLRIVAAVVYAVVCVSLSSVWLLTATLLGSAALMLAARLPLAKTLRRVVAMDTFIIAMIAFLPFTMDGTPMFSLFGFPASYEGLIRATEIALTANAVVMALLALVGSMEEVTFGQALHGLKVPPNLVHLMLFTVRYIDVLRQEYQRLRQAMKCRGFRPGTNSHTYRTFGYLVGMMVIRAMERSERILDSMKCRGFTGQLPMLARHSMTGYDLAFALVFGGFAATILFLEFTNGFV